MIYLAGALNASEDPEGIAEGALGICQGRSAITVQVARALPRRSNRNSGGEPASIANNTISGLNIFSAYKPFALSGLCWVVGRLLDFYE